MNIIYSDENDKLTPEIWNLMQKAAETGLEFEFGEELSDLGADASDTACEIGVTIVGDDEILELNREYREKDKVTDVLSFPQYEGHEDILRALINEEDADVLIGDVVICYDQAMRQSEEYGTGATRELLYLFVHSLMHLFGYDHTEEDEKRVMRAKEEDILGSIGVR